MLNNVLIQIYERDLEKLRAEIELYTDETDLWTTSGEIANSAGNLCLHLAGNLKHFFGTVLGGSDYVRDRDAEFSDTGVSKEKLLADIIETAAVVKNALQQLTEDDFARDYPIEVFGHPMTTAFFLVHLATHLNWHLGQINYHRRLLTATD